MKTKILWIGTSYPPAPGGGAVYAKMITERLSDNYKDALIRLVVEKYPGEAVKKTLSDNLIVDRYFPFRGGRDKTNLMSYPLYLLQNLLLISLYISHLKEKIDVVVFHSWYFSNPSLALFVAKLFKRSGVKTVLDTRDVSINESTLMKLHVFDTVISCGQRVSNYIKKNPNLANKIIYIPTPFDPIKVDTSNAIGLISKYQLFSKKYIFSPNGISSQKSFSLLYSSWCEIVRQGYCFDLVIAGKERSSLESYDKCISGARLIFLGKLSPECIHCFYAEAALSVNVSRNEGLPRVPLEAIHHNTPLIFPPDTPEFDRAFPEKMVANSDDPAILASNMCYLIENSIIAADYYDVSIHSVENAARNSFEALVSAVNK